jgi:xanthine/uracil/vitamin C permease (AzgA family)
MELAVRGATLISLGRLVNLSQVFSFFLGFLFQSIQVTFASFGLGVAAILVVSGLILPRGMLNEHFTLVHVKLVIPPWSIYNKHPVTWLPAKERKEKQQ